MRGGTFVDFLAADISPGQRGWAARIGRRWWLLALGLVIGLVAGERYLAVSAKQYTATSTVTIELAPAVVAQAQLRDTAMANELLWAQSPQVAQRAKTSMGSTVDVTTLQSQATEAIPANSQLITFTFTGSSAEQARSGAEAFATAFVDERDALRQADQKRRELTLSAQAAATQLQIQTYSAELANGANGTVKAFASSQITLLRYEASLLNTELTGLSTDTSHVAVVVDDASLPTAPTKPVPLVVLAAALLVGLLIGGAAAVVLARRDRRVRVAGDVPSWAGLTLVGSVRGRGRARAPVALADDRLSRTAFGSLRVRLWQSASGGDPGVVALVPTGRSHGASFAAVNLAASLSRQGHLAVVVCADGRSPSPQVLGAGSSPGLSDLLRGTATLDAVVHPSATVPGVFVLPPGADIDEALNQIPRTVLDGHLRDLVARGAFVAVETPATADGVTGLEVARLAGAVVLVAEIDASRTPDLHSSADELESSGSRLLGVVAVPRLVSARKGARGKSEPVGEGEPARALETQTG